MNLLKRFISFFFPKFGKTKYKRAYHNPDVLNEHNLLKELKKTGAKSILFIVSPRLRIPAIQLVESLYIYPEKNYDITIHIDPFFTGMKREWAVIGTSKQEVEFLKQVWSKSAKKEKKNIKSK